MPIWYYFLQHVFESRVGFPGQHLNLKEDIETLAPLLVQIQVSSPALNPPLVGNTVDPSHADDTADFPQITRVRVSDVRGLLGDSDTAGVVGRLAID
jgi:hypothetical protein